MVQVAQASTLSLHDVKAKFHLQETVDDSSFLEWQQDLPDVTESDKQALDQIKAYLLYLSKYPTEETVKMVVLSPLLVLAGFYQPPFRMATEAPIEIALEDAGEVVRGRIDVLVLQERFWVLAIESKQATFSLKDAIPQALAYMAATPYLDQPAFGLVTNGSEFRFIKLMMQEMPQYGLSDLLTLQRRDKDLVVVLGILRRVSQLLLA